MNVFFNIAFSILMATCIFLVCCDLFRIPTYKTSKALAGMEKHYSTQELRINSTLEQVAIWLSEHILLREHKKAVIQANLNTARMVITPERFISDCIVKAVVLGVLGIPFLFIFIPIALVIFAFAVIYYFDLVKNLERMVENHRKSIEYELSQFVFTIERVLTRSRNVVLMLENYKEIAGPEMEKELEITLADMKSGNYEQAISRLEIRVGSYLMSDVCRGLISVIRGDDTMAYWVNLEQKLTAHHREILKKKAATIPGKVDKLSMALLFCFMSLWLGVLIMQMVEAFAELFSVL